MAVNIHPTAIIDKEVEIGVDVEIGPYSIISGKVKIGDGCKIRNNVTIDGFTTIGKNCTFWPYAAIGFDPQDLKYKNEISTLTIGDNNIFREFSTVHRGTKTGIGYTKVGNNCLIMSCTHIAHDSIVGDGVIMANYSGLAGHVTIGNNVTLSAYCGVQQFLKVGDYSFIGSYCLVRQNVVPYVVATGNDISKVIKVNVVKLERCAIKKEDQEVINKIYRIFFRTGLSPAGAVAEIKKAYSDNSYANIFCDFVESAKGGILK